MCEMLQEELGPQKQGQQECETPFMLSEPHARVHKV